MNINERGSTGRVKLICQYPDKTLYNQRPIISDDIGHVWLSYTVDWTSMAISNGKFVSSLYYNGPLTILTNSRFCNR